MCLCTFQSYWILIPFSLSFQLPPGMSESWPCLTKRTAERLKWEREIKEKEKLNSKRKKKSGNKEKEKNCDVCEAKFDGEWSDQRAVNRRREKGKEERIRKSERKAIDRPWENRYRKWRTFWQKVFREVRFEHHCWHVQLEERKRNKSKITNNKKILRMQPEANI